MIGFIAFIVGVAVGYAACHYRAKLLELLNRAKGE